MANMTSQNAYQFSFNNIEGDQINLSDLNNKVILVVNTASKCGFTPQYEGLQKLHEKYKDRGLVIIGVPSSDFANQEFGKILQIKEFVDEKFKITFPLTSITKVRGNNAHPFYLWANRKAGFIGSPKWNFHKYLIDKNGNFETWFSSATKPESTKIINKIEDLLWQ
jgi:glutathione peroxidase